MRILIIEDESPLANFIKKGLQESGYVVDVAEDGRSGEFMVNENHYDLILLDLLLPDKDGTDLCQGWRKAGITTPIIMLTAKDDKEDIIHGLDCGADDYVVKPFSFAELLARIRTILRRTSMTPATSKLTIDDLEMDLTRREVTRGHQKIHLSVKEFSLLEFLLRNKGRVCTKTEILEHVWGYFFETNTNIIEVTINHLRKKLNCGSRRALIHTVRGVGYIIKEWETME
ncbi:MAG: DNA-binding response regulator [Calditrichaeota bacterium]|nr:MAG: DNA-binding response regulator [Calditrichota bacterium]